MRIPHGGIGHEQLLLIVDPLGEALGPHGVEQMLEAHIRRDLAGCGRIAGRFVDNAHRIGGGNLLLGDIAEDAVCTVSRIGQIKELRSGIDKLGVALPAQEGGVG